MVFEHMYGADPVVPATADEPTEKELPYNRAVNKALEWAMTAHPEVLVYGEDVGAAGGIFGVTRGLQKAFGEERVFDTPIAEAAICCWSCSLSGAIGSTLCSWRMLSSRNRLNDWKPGSCLISRLSSSANDCDHIFSFEFTPTGKPDIAKGKGVPATIKLFVDGAPIGNGDLPVTVPLTLGLAAGISVGADAGAPVMTDYKPPFAFTGTVKKGLVDVSGEAIVDMAAKMKMYLARQ